MEAAVPLNIKRQEADRAARELAELTGESITQAVIRSVEERLARERSRRAAGNARRELLRIGERYRSSPVIDDRRGDEMLGYAEHGLPSG
jgi:antitoxin VapB